MDAPIWKKEHTKQNVSTAPESDWSPWALELCASTAGKPWGRLGAQIFRTCRVSTWNTTSRWMIYCRTHSKGGRSYRAYCNWVRKHIQKWVAKVVEAEDRKDNCPACTVGDVKAIEKWIKTYKAGSGVIKSKFKKFWPFWEVFVSL